MLLGHYLSLLHHAQQRLGGAFRAVADAHDEDGDVERTSRRLAAQCEQHAKLLEDFVGSYRDEAGEEPENLHSELFRGPRTGSLGLLRDLNDLYLMAAECDVVWTLVGQAAQGARDHDLLEVVNRCGGETAIQLQWLLTVLKQAAPQALVVSS